MDRNREAGNDAGGGNGSGTAGPDSGSNAAIGRGEFRVECGSECHAELLTVSGFIDDESGPTENAGDLQLRAAHREGSLRL